MKLSDSEIRMFFKLWFTLIWSVNHKHKIVPDFIKPVYGELINKEQIYAVRNELWENPQWIDEFLLENDCGELTETERGILTDWRRNFIKNEYFVVKHTAKYSVFMDADDTDKLYGVCGISDSIKDTTYYAVPFMVETVLLPFMGRIIYDGFLVNLNISFGKGIRDELKMSYNEAKEKIGIIESIGEPPVPVKPTEKKPKPQKLDSPDTLPKAANVPKAMTARYLEVAEIVEKFCDEKLNDEYKEVCLRALAKLCRKRPSPLVSGKANTWACGIVYAIGSNNFIFDKSQPVNMTAGEISEWFGLSKNTAGSKAADIKKLLNLSYYNAEFLLKSHIDDNPAIWYLSVNGFFVDIRTMPREVQEEAFRKGYIPYIPADNGE